MGAITTKLESAPDPSEVPFDPATNVKEEKDANQAAREKNKAFVRKFIGEIVAKGIAAPAKEPGDLSKEELHLYLQKVIGDRIKTELSSDPLELGYANMSNDDVAAMLNEPLVMSGKKMSGTHVMEIIAPLDLQVITLARAKGMAVDLRPLGDNLRGKILRIDKAGKGAKAAAKLEVAPEGRQEKLITSNLTNKVELALPLETLPELGDIVVIIDNDTSILPSRIHQILIGIPFAPNVVTADDVGAARQ